MEKSKIAEQLASILPERPSEVGINGQNMDSLIAQEAHNFKAKTEAKEIARRKYAEKQKLKNMQKKEEAMQALAEELGVENLPNCQTEHQARELVEQQKKIEALEAIEAEIVRPLDAEEVANRGKSYTSRVKQAMQLQGTTRPEIAKLLTALNINMSVQLTKQDTANLLACLLTCNETQLDALYKDKKVPLAIKAIIKRIQEDAKYGEIETIEKLWDRIFGKGQMQLDLPAGQQLETGIIPNVPISREAYVIIRDTLIK